MTERAIKKSADINSARIRRARKSAGITEQINTWARWKALGFEVQHGSKALLGLDLLYPSKGFGAVYKARFFGRSQVQPIA